MRLLTPPSSRQGASPATRDLSPGDKLRTSRTSPLSRSDLVLWHLATTADQTLCPLLVKAVWRGPALRYSPYPPAPTDAWLGIPRPPIMSAAGESGNAGVEEGFGF